MEVKVLGPGCARCKKLYEETEKAVAWSGVRDVQVRKVERIEEIVAHGVMMTPALIINGVVMCQGTIPDAQEIARWLCTEAAKRTGIRPGD